MRQLVTALMHPSRYQWGLRPWTRHSIVLVVAGVVYAAVGVTYLATDPSPTRLESLRIALEIASLPTWGAVWITAGIAAVISSRWPPASEKWGYAVLSSLSGCWAAVYVLGVASGPTQSLSGGLVWGLVAFMWWAIAGLWNPDPTLVRLAPDPAHSVVPDQRDDRGTGA